MKKSLALFILCALMITLFTACAPASENPDNPKDNEGTTNEGAAKDMGEAIFMLGSIDLHEFVFETAVSGPGDKMMVRYKDIEDKYNCKLEFHQTVGTNESGEVVELIAAGRQVPDFYDMKSVSVYDLYKQDLIQDYKALENLDITSTRWGTEAFLKQVSFGDGVYGIWPNDWENPVPQMGNIVLMNNNLIAANELTSPYEMLEKGEWTWANFEEMLKQLTVIEESKSVYGLASHTKDILLNSAIYSNGGQKVIVKNGKYKFGYTDEKTLEAVNWVKSLFDSKVIQPTGGSPEQFSNEDAVFLVCDSWVGTADVVTALPWLPMFNLENFGWMPFPYGPKGEYGSWNALSYHNQRFFPMIPTENEPEDIAIIMNALFAPLQDSTPEGWKTFAKRQMFHEEKGFANFANLIENIKCDYSAILGQSIVDKINSALVKASGNSETATASMAAIEEIVNTRLDTELNS